MIKNASRTFGTWGGIFRIRRKFGISFLFVTLAAVCVASFLSYMAYTERAENYYPSYEAAQKDGAFERGWLPNSVPSSSYEIHEEHDLDTNMNWVKFRGNTADIKSMLKGMRQLSDSEIASIRFASPRADWWFEEFVQQSPANDNALSADVYTAQCERVSGQAYVAIDRARSDIVYYWCQP